MWLEKNIFQLLACESGSSFFSRRDFSLGLSYFWDDSLCLFWMSWFFLEWAAPWKCSLYIRKSFMHSLKHLQNKEMVHESFNSLVLSWKHSFLFTLYLYVIHLFVKNCLPWFYDFNKVYLFLDFNVYWLVEMCVLLKWK